MKAFKLSVTAIFLLSVSYVVAEPEVNIEKEYYTVRGETEKEIRNDMNKNTPVRSKGKKYDAYTSWYVSWHFWWNEERDSCEITEVSTTVDVKYTLPELEDVDSLEDEVRTKWENYMSALIEHEDGHKDFGISAAKAIEDGILSLEPRPSCQKLESDANELGYSIIKEYGQLEKKYDLDTNHGMNNGAVFP